MTSTILPWSNPCNACIESKKSGPYSQRGSGRSAFEQAGMRRAHAVRISKSICSRSSANAPCKASIGSEVRLPCFKALHSSRSLRLVSRSCALLVSLPCNRSFAADKARRCLTRS